MAIVLSRELLAALCPRPSNAAKAKIWDGYVAALVSEKAGALFGQFEITTKLRMAHLLAQWAHECAGFTIIYESGAYSAKRIMQIFGVGHHSAAVTQAEANRLAGNGYALFERVYGLGNPRKARELGNTQKGDGWRFRGTGIVQLTGRAAHERYAGRIGCALDELCEPINAIHGALLEWQEKNCNAAADRDDIVAVTKKVNGGRNGLADRRMYLARAERLLASVPDVPGLPPVPEAKPQPKAVVAIGDEGASVREVQEMLARAGYAIPIDGKMGPRTEGAIAAFQVNHGLPGTGVTDKVTVEALREAKPPAERDVDVKALEKGSRVIKYASRLRGIVVWVMRSILAGLLWIAHQLGLSPPDGSSGIDVAEKATETADRVNTIASKFGGIPSLNDPRLWILLALVLLGLVCLYFGRQLANIINARVEDAKTGVNLSV